MALPERPIESLTVVIPCKNEEAAIPAVLRTALEAKQHFLREGLFHQVELIVVDDQSTDRSFDILSAAGSEFRVLRTRAGAGAGYGAALKTGFELARGDVIGFYDMDCTYDPFDLGRLVHILRRDHLEMVAGNRLSLLSKMPWTRKFGNFLFKTLIQSLFQNDVQDCCSGIR